MKNIVYAASAMKDISWNSGVNAQVFTRPGGWKLTAVFPRKNFPDFNKNGFVANFAKNRVVNSGASLFTWSPFLKKSSHEPEAFGNLVFDKKIPENLVSDGDFAVDMRKDHCFGAWSAFHTLPENVSVELDKSSFIFVDRSLKLSYTGQKLVKNFHAFQELPKMKPNTKYRISYFLKTENVTPVQSSGRPGVTVNIWSSGNHFFPSAAWTGTHDWIFESYEFTSGPKTNLTPDNRAYIMLWLGGASGTVWFDGIRLEEVAGNKKI